MKNNKIRMLCFTLTFILVLLTSSCINKGADISDGNSTITTQEEDTQEATQEKALSEEQQSELTQDNLDAEDTEMESKKTETESIEPTATKEISIYTMNEASLEVEVVSALIPEDTEITPELIVNLVVDSLEDRLVFVGVDSVTTKKDSVIVSFKKDQAPFANGGSGLEATILDAIAQSLVDNLADYQKVIFRVNGEAYASGHFEFGIDEVYLDGNGTK